MKPKILNSLKFFMNHHYLCCLSGLITIHINCITVCFFFWFHRFIHFLISCCILQSFFIREMQIQTIKQGPKFSHWWNQMLVRMWSKRNSLTHCWWECKMVQLLWKTVWLFLTKLNTFYHKTQQFYSLEFTQRKQRHIYT